MPGDHKHPLTTGEQRGLEITHYFWRQHAVSSPAALIKMAPPRVNPASTAASTSKQGTQAGAAAKGDLPSLASRPISPILSPAIPHSDLQPDSEHTGGSGGHSEGSLQDIVVDLPTKQDLHAMAASIVNALTRELHDLPQQVDTVEERVTVLESSTTTTDAHITTLETEHQAFHRHFVEVQLRLDDEENRSRRDNLHLCGIPEATMRPDLCATVVAILDQVLASPLPLS